MERFWETLESMWNANCTLPTEDFSKYVSNFNMELFLANLGDHVPYLHHVLCPEIATYFGTFLLLLCGCLLFWSLLRLTWMLFVPIVVSGVVILTVCPETMKFLLSHVGTNAEKYFYNYIEQVLSRLLSMEQ